MRFDGHDSSQDTDNHAFRRRLRKEAWRAGVDAFLLKPRGVDKVASTIDRLLEDRKKNERKGRPSVGSGAAKLNAKL